MKILHFIIFFLLQIYNISGKDNLVKMDEIYFKDTNYTKLKEYIEKYKNQIAVSVVPLENSHTPFFYNKSEVFVSASMIKLLILCEFIEEIDHETIYLDQNYTYEEKDYVEGAGEIQKMPFGTIFTYDTLARYMIKYSDNIATNVLIDILGMDNINLKAKELGLNATKLNRKMMKEGEQNYMSSEDIEFILKGILYKTVGSEKMCDKAMDYLLENDDYDAIVRGLPNGTKFAHKTGSLDFIRHDGGIVFIKNKYIIIVLTKDFQLEEDANLVIGNVSAIAYDIMSKDPQSSQSFINYSILAMFLFLALLI